MKFNSFNDVADLLKKKRDSLEGGNFMRLALKETGKYATEKLKDAHGKKQEGWLDSMMNSTPLLKTGKLRDAITYIVLHNGVKIYSKLPKLGLIHEYGAMWKMTEKQRKFLMAKLKEKGAYGKFPARPTWGSGYIKIPPRPIWNSFVDKERNSIINNLKDLFKNFWDMGM